MKMIITILVASVTFVTPAYADSITIVIDGDRVQMPLSDARRLLGVGNGHSVGQTNRYFNQRGVPYPEWRAQNPHACRGIPIGGAGKRVYGPGGKEIAAIFYCQ